MRSDLSRAGRLFGGASTPGGPLSSRLCDATAAGFALWTIACHVTVGAGGNLYHAIAAFACAALAAAFAARRFAGRAPEPPDAGAARPDGRGALALRGAVLLAGTAAALAISSERHPVAIWWIAIASLGLATAALVVAQRPHWPRAAGGARLEAGLWALALGCAVFALGVHRPDLDDSFYINVAVAAADAPQRALLSGDTLLGVAGLPLHMPAHRLHSYELWNGAVSLLSGIPALYVFHWIAAAVVAAMIPLCLAVLFRLLTPAHWLWSVAACVAVLLASGETHRSFGNFAFVRSWQGKSIFLFVFTPLVYAYAIRFALRPTGARWLRLAAAQIAALGCSSTAVWAAPAGALAALCCGLQPTRRGLATFAWGALASFYVLAAGVLLRGEMAPMLAPEIQTFALGAQLDSALTHAFGTGRLLVWGVASVLVAWACCPRGLARRFAAVVPLAVFAVLLDPYWDRFVSANVTGPSYWRALWALPAPVLAALVLCSPLQLGSGRSGRIAARCACAALIAGFAVGIPRYTTFSADNGAAGGLGIWIGAPAPKIPPAQLTWARMLRDAVPAGSTVVAPPDVSVWMPVLEGGVHPLQARRLYLERQAAVLGVDDANERILMTRYAGGQSGWEDAADGFRRGLERFGVDGVCLRESELADAGRAVLRDAGFVRTVHAPHHEIWVRAGAGGRR